jgi:hypothetical protein
LSTADKLYIEVYHNLHQHISNTTARIHFNKPTGYAVTNLNGNQSKPLKTKQSLTTFSGNALEGFQKDVLEQGTHKPACWFWYVADTSAIWPHGQEKLTVSEPPQWISHKYLVHTVKRRRRPPSVSGYRHLQETGWLPRSQSLSEAHSYQSLYTLGFTSPTYKQTNKVLASLIHRATALCDQDSLTQELEFLTTVKRKMDTALSRYKPWTL